jgi:hypothetical protein
VKILVIDGQGGGVGRALIAALKQQAPDLALTALGTNAAATAAMLRAGADQGATGESAIRYQCRTADVIVALRVLHANALWWGNTPSVAAAVSLATPKGADPHGTLRPAHRGRDQTPPGEHAEAARTWLAGFRRRETTNEKGTNS